MKHIRLNDPVCEAWHKHLVQILDETGFYHSIRLPDGQVLPGVQPIEMMDSRVAEFPIPENLRGKRVLDIGAWDGYFAFEMERRGAKVVAIDSTEVENFYIARRLIGSQVEYLVQDVYDVSIPRNGRFDYVLFLGVLYHLKHPLLALERVCEVTRDMAIVESFVTNEGFTGAVPALEFYETTELLGQIDNWCGPNVECLLAMCRTAGFARVDLLRVKEQRAVVVCRRTWDPEPESPAADPPLLLAATHASNYGVNVRRGVDEFVTAYFKSNETDLTIHTVFPEVGGFGVHPVSVTNLGGDGWQANFHLARGLDAGWHPVRIRTARSRYSEPARLAVDVPLGVTEVRILSVRDGKTGAESEVTAGEATHIAIEAAGLTETADIGNIRVQVAGMRLKLQHVSAPGAKRLLHARIPPHFPRGAWDLEVRAGDVVSAPWPLRVV